MSLMKLVVMQMFAGVIPMFLGFGANPADKLYRNVYGGDQAIAARTGSAAADESAQLNPFFSQEMRATHSMTPDQQNQFLTSAEAGSGAAFGDAAAEAQRNAARTGNATTLTSSLDDMARQKAKVAAGAGEQLATQDAAGTTALHQAGAAGMQGLYGLNTNAQLGAMQGSDAAAKGVQESNPGVLSAIEGIVKTGADAATAYKGFK